MHIICNVKIKQLTSGNAIEIDELNESSSLKLASMGQFVYLYESKYFGTFPRIQIHTFNFKI